MTAHDYKPGDTSWRRLDDDRFDSELDAALAKYAAVEPRADLDERILANLRAERERVSIRGWWRWTAVAALAAVVIVVALSLVFRSAHQQQSLEAHPPLTVTPRDDTHIGKQASQPAPVKKRTVRTPHRLPIVAAATPHLEQFPSRQPLSEQEKILESYIVSYPEHAALIAQARAESLLRDAAEEMSHGQAKNED